MTATTAQAATAFGVTANTVRAWCRIGAVKAVKQAGRWIIDTASLIARKTIAHQITEARQTRARKATMNIEVFRHPSARVGKMRQGHEGRWTFKVDGKTYPRHYATREEAEQAAEEYTPPKPTTPKPAPAETATPRIPAKGWSKASRRRAGGYAHRFMEDLTGAPSPAKPGQCHYCGLPSATCDCR